MDAKDLADYAISKFEGITLGEFKYIERKTQFLGTRNNIVTNIGSSRELGFGIRVLLNGAWGFSASTELSKNAVDKALVNAKKLANAATIRNPNVILSEDPVIEDKRSTDYKIDPFSIPFQEKIDYFIDAAKVAKEVDEIKFANGNWTAENHHMIFYNSEGTKIEQNVLWNGGFMTLIASGNSDTQTRKFKDDNYGTVGWELMKELDLSNSIKPIAEEMPKLLESPKIKSGKSSIILNPSQVGLQLHESCGHPSELDRALSYEAAYAGTSFLKPHLLNENFMYGNELVSINADATIPGALGTFPYDHEGVRGKNTPLVKNGKFIGYLSSRETAPLIGLTESGGSMRSDTYNKIPLIRMTNIVLQPDPNGMLLDEMIAETKDGYYFNTNRSWSIDDIRLNFQFGCEVGYRIVNGEIVGMVRNPTYTGITNEFWNSVSAVGNERELEVLGTPTCGKGEPGQGMFTGHGGPPTRFENVRVGVIAE